MSIISWRRRRLGQDSPGAQCNHMALRLLSEREQFLALVERAPEQTIAQRCPGAALVGTLSSQWRGAPVCQARQ